MASRGMATPAGIEPAVAAKLASHITLSAGPHEQIPVRAPYTGEVLGYLPAAQEADVELAVDRARAAQAEWAARSFGERGRIFLRFHDLLLARQSEVLDLIQMETGKDYIVDMPGHADPVPQPLSAVPCTAPTGERAIISYRVVFRSNG